MTEAVAWMYERRPEAYPPTKMLVALERRLDISELQFWTETPQLLMFNFMRNLIRS
jgi:hypothetical protein